MPLPPNDPSHVAGPTVRLQLAGALDILTAPEELERILVEGRHAGACVELDLGGVEFIDSSGIAIPGERSRITRSNVVPDLETPRTKSGGGVIRSVR